MDRQREANRVIVKADMAREAVLRLAQVFDDDPCDQIWADGSVGREDPTPMNNCRGFVHEMVERSTGRVIRDVIPPHCRRKPGGRRRR